MKHVALHEISGPKSVRPHGGIPSPGAEQRAKSGEANGWFLVTRCDSSKGLERKVIRARDADADADPATEDPIPRACRYPALAPPGASARSGHSPPECRMEGTKRQCRERGCAYIY
jgi:hypothetical protein